MLFYDVADLEHPRLVREHVVPLPVFQTADNKRRVAAQSELLALGAHHFLLLCRDGGNGYGLPSAASLYRRIELLDTSQASNIAGSPFDATTPVAPEGKLVDGITTATPSPFIDLNDNAELGLASTTASRTTAPICRRSGRGWGWRRPSTRPTRATSSCWFPTTMISSRRTGFRPAPPTRIRAASISPRCCWCTA
jgi:hypothetical protein